MIDDGMMVGTELWWLLVLTLVILAIPTLVKYLRN